MNVSAKTLKQLEEALAAIVAKCPTMKQQAVLSDIYMMVSPATGELYAFDDDDRELCCVEVEEWKGDNAEEMLREAQKVLQEFLKTHHDRLETINMLRPFSFVLVDEAYETLAELYLVDDDTILIPGELMEGLNEDLAAFLKKLMEE